MSPEVEHHIHESPGSMTLPLMILAAGSVVVGWLGIPHVMGQYLGHVGNAFERFLEPVFEHPLKLEQSHGSESLEWGLMLLSVAIATVGLMLARSFYLQNPALPEKLRNRFHSIYITLLNKYWVDELYDALFVHPIRLISTYILWKLVDVTFIDGTVNATGSLVRRAGLGLKHFQSGYTRAYACWILVGAVIAIAYIEFT